MKNKVFGTEICINNKGVAGELTLGASYLVTRITDTAMEVVNDNGERKMYDSERFKKKTSS